MIPTGCCDWSVQVTVYLGKRDFVDHLDHVDPVGESCLPVNYVCVGRGGNATESNV